MPSSVKQIRNHKRYKSKHNYKVHKKKTNIRSQRKTKRDSMERKCIDLFGSKKKSNKFIKQAILKGNQIRTKTKYLRFDYQGYQVLMENNDTATNKKLGLKALINIDYGGDKTAKRMDHNHNHTTSIDESSNYPSLYPSQFQYTAKDDILILGEMDFSYAVDIAHNIGGNNIIATAYYSQQNTKTDTKENVSMFHSLNGKQVLFDIDATALKLDDAKCLKFDKILFGFPRNSYAPNSQKHNIIFMRQVFDEVEKHLNDGGQFQLLLHINQSGHSPLEQWKLDYPNWKCVHEQIFNQKQMKHMFSMYQSHDGQMNKWLPYQSGLYVFQR